MMLGHCDGEKRWHETSPGTRGQNKKSLVGEAHPRYLQGQKKAPEEKWSWEDRGQGCKTWQGSERVTRTQGGAAQGRHCAACPLPLGPDAGPLREPRSAEPASEEDSGIERIYS